VLLTSNRRFIHSVDGETRDAYYFSAPIPLAGFRPQGGGSGQTRPRENE
jgi:hypothetical protein